MATRTPPTIDEIIAAFEALPKASERAFMYYDTIRVIAPALHTTQQRAAIWLQDACTKDPQMRLLWCRGYGLSSVIRDNPEPDDGYKYAGVEPKTLGLPETAIYLNDGGEQVFDVGKATGRDLQWFILRSTFERMATEANTWNNKERERRKEEQRTEQQAWASKHDLRLLLGLYDLIGIVPRTYDVRTHVYENGTVLTLDFRDEEIDKFLDGLRKLGVKPRQPKSKKT